MGEDVVDVVPGRYQHYKGQFYVVLGTARHSESEEWMVVYRKDYDDRGWWVRPLGMFAEQVLVDGRRLPRFKLVEPDST